MNARKEPITLKMLDLSTAHLTAATREVLASNTFNGALYYPKVPWGWFMYVPSLADGFELDDSLPHDLKLCLEYAQAKEFDWVMFDCDGTCLDALPMYEDVAADTNGTCEGTRQIANEVCRVLHAKLGITTPSTANTLSN